MFVKFSPDELDHLNRLRTLRAEREREFLQLDNITRGFVEYLARAHGVHTRPWSLTPDCLGLDVVTPIEVQENA